MKYQVNEETGNNEAIFSAELLSVSDKVLNEKQTQYRVGTIRFEDDGGIKHTVTTVIYEKSYQRGMIVGETYQAVAQETEKGVFIHTSHLTNSERATVDMFNFSEATVSQVKESEVSVFSK
jgi:hypothetical protein